MMSKRERIMNIGLAIACISTLTLAVKHFFSPSQATLAVIGIMTACTATILAFSAYEWLKEGLTGRKE